MNKILLITCFVFVASMISKAADTTFTINGKFAKVKSGKIYLSYAGAGTTIKDSTRIMNGIFKFKGSLRSPANAAISLASKNNDWFSFYLEPRKLTITGSGDSLKLLTIKGSPLNDDDKVLKQRLADISKWEEDVNKIYGDAFKDKNKTVMDSLDDVSDNILKEKRKVVARFVKDYPHSMRSAMAITENFAYYAEAEEVEPLYNLLDDNLKNSEKGKAIKKMVDAYKSVAIGKVPPDFTQTTPDGKQVSLSSMKGKYVLVDFWASWCGPCRRENPNVVKTYNQFKDKGFDIFGVSYDTNKDKWVKAIADDGLVWMHVSDLKGWKNATSELYGIRAIPTNFLLDKDGKIIAKNIIGKKLVAKLSEILP